VEQTPIEPDRHSFGEWSVIEEASCKKEGTAQRSCIDCGEPEQKPIPKEDHADGEWVVAKPATKKESGLREKHCNECGEVMDIEIIPIVEGCGGSYEGAILPLALIVLGLAAVLLLNKRKA